MRGRGHPGTLALALSLAALPLVAGCDMGVLTGECTGDRRVVVVEVDHSASQADAALLDEKVALVAGIADAVSRACGSLHVELFRTSETDIVPVFADTMVPEGRTEGAREDHRPALVESVRGALAAALAATPPGDGSAPYGSIARGARLLHQADAGVPRSLVVISDGLETEQFELRLKKLRPDTAEAFAERLLPAPEDLTGIAVTIAGVGRAAGEPLPSATLEGLLAFWSIACGRTGAAACRVVDTLALGTIPVAG